ncbi:MAG: flagellar export chaperone FliS [Desulfovibrionaceae bacterium]|nr:flagellar export chaperone FliS [Desulfovibrionaceae bacterium]
MGNILPFRRLKAEDNAYLLLRLYDGALLSINGARRQMVIRDYSGKGRHIARAMDILAELSRSLDREHRLAHNLANLYLLCTAKLLQASSRLETAPLDTAATIIGRLRGAVSTAMSPRRERPARVLRFVSASEPQA